MKKLLILIVCLWAAGAKAQTDSLYQAKLKHPDTLVVISNTIANFNALNRDVEELRKKLAIAAQYDAAKELIRIWEQLVRMSQLQIVDPELYNPKKPVGGPPKKWVYCG